MATRLYIGLLPPGGFVVEGGKKGITLGGPRSINYIRFKVAYLEIDEYSDFVSPHEITSCRGAEFSTEA